MSERLSKLCEKCGRSFSWRKKWERDWDQIKFCSERCRRAKSPARQKEIEASILGLLQKRGVDKTICPSEVLSPNEKSDRLKMEEVREVARHLVQRGLLQITQNGKVVDPDAFRGPIRLRLKK